MNKVLAEIIAGVIPHKMTRNRWRGLLRYGLFNAWRLKRRLKRDHTQPKYYLAVCAIAKNEGPYFKEWIEWHRAKGVEKFYIYDNESTDGTREVLAPYIESGLVDYTYFPGRKRQLAAYDDCFDRHRLEAHRPRRVYRADSGPHDSRLLAPHGALFGGGNQLVGLWQRRSGETRAGRRDGTFPQAFVAGTSVEHARQEHCRSAARLYDDWLPRGGPAFRAGSRFARRAAQERLRRPHAAAGCYSHQPLRGEVL